MKKKLLLYFLVAGIGTVVSGSVIGQTVATASWTLDGSSSVDNANLLAEDRQLSNLRTHSTITNVSGISGTQFQRITMTDTAPIEAHGGNSNNISNDLPFTTFHNSIYIEYQIKPSVGKYLQITGISLDLLGSGTGNVRAVVKYSVDGVNFKNFYKKGVYNSVETYASDDEPLVPFRDNVAGKTEQDVVLTFSDLQINVTPTQTFYLRVYPYQSSAPNTHETLGVGGSGTRTVVTKNTSIEVKISDTALPSVLPLDILSFTAKSNALGNAINLNWQTANEVNTKEFVIERRTENTTFVAIQSVASKNAPGIHNYSFIDNDAQSGNVYYRLKQVDRDGKFLYSDVVQVNVEGNLPFTVYPNPVEDVLQVAHGAASNASLRILALDGKVVVNQSASGGATSVVNVANLAAGTYLVVYSAEGQQTTAKFVKK